MTNREDVEALKSGFRSYLGGGVYASYNGDAVQLAVNAEDNNVVAMDWPVLDALADYRKRLEAAIEASLSDEAQAPRKMTAHQFEKHLEKLGLSQTGFSRLVGVGDRTVRRWIADDAIPSEIALLVRVMLKTQITAEEAGNL